MQKIGPRRGKYKGPVNPRLMKRAQQTIQKDAVVFIGIRLEYLYIYEEKHALVVGALMLFHLAALTP